MCIIRIIWDPTGAGCLWFANLYRHFAGKIMDHRQYSRSADLTEKSVLLRALVRGSVDIAKGEEPDKNIKTKLPSDKLI